MAPNPHLSLAAKCTLAVARLPWWAWAVLAVATSVALHTSGMRTQLIVMDGSQPGAASPGFLPGGLLSELQLLVPPLCLVCVPLVRELLAGLHALAVPVDDRPLGIMASEYASLGGTAPGLPPSEG